MSDPDPLVTLLIAPADEARVMDAIRSELDRVDDGPTADSAGLELVDTEDDPDLRRQWGHEHPDEPVGDRRVREIVGRVSGRNRQLVGETIINVICPHARYEDESLDAGRAFTPTPDEFPWSCHTYLWEEP
ncbi:MAG: hypothetical protein ACTH1D_05495 [Mycobacteriaceae bacterium]|uniref:hypothetical protein n=1 Tax=Corynebacterium sp. TaxID=1720 RepID=UPI003F97587E